MSYAEKFCAQFTDFLSTLFGEVKEIEGHDDRRNKIIEDCGKVYESSEGHMIEFFRKYKEIHKKLKTTKNMLSGSQSVEERNAALQDLKNDIVNFMEMFVSYTDKIENDVAKSEACQKSAQSEIQDLKKDHPLDYLISSCEYIGRAYSLGRMGVEAAREHIKSEEVLKCINSDKMPIYLFCIAVVAIGVAQVCKYFRKEGKREELTEDLEDVLKQLKKLSEKTNELKTSHSNIFAYLTRYIESIDTEIDGLNEEESPEIFLGQTEIIKDHFEAVKSQAEENVRFLTESFDTFNSQYFPSK